MAPPRPLTLILPTLLLGARSQHAWYSWDTEETDFKNFASYLRWTQADKGDVYLATQFYTGCSGGYFGGQLHSDGTHSILFSMWDFNASAKTAHGVSPWCGRFGGEGEGAHCGLEYVFEFGVEYRYTLTKASNSSGTLWSVTVTKEGPTEVPTFLGTIFIASEGLEKDCTVLEPRSVSFQEYYLGGTFYSAAAWRGPFLSRDPQGAPALHAGLAPVDAAADCGNATAHSNVSSSVPLGPAGAPNVFYQMGGNTEHGCEASMWQHNKSAAMPTTPQFRRRPTAVGATAGASASAGAALAPRVALVV